MLWPRTCRLPPLREPPDPNAVTLEPKQAVELLAGDRLFEALDCGVTELGRWLRRSAGVAALTGTAATYVLCRGRRVVGCYALAMSSIPVESGA